MEADGAELEGQALVSIVMPCHNAGAYLDEALGSVRDQTYRPLELSVWDDHSTDDSLAKVLSWKPKLEEVGIRVAVTSARDGKDGPAGIGCARNGAVRASSGVALCHLDADDIMLPGRVESQMKALRQNPRALIGSKFRRTPEGSTPYYTAWINGLTPKRLLLEQYRECTVICPSWFYSRRSFERAGGYVEDRDNPEDLTFFNVHLDAGGALARVDEELVVYRYVPGSFSGRTSKRTLQRARIPFLERRVLCGWPAFTIWGAGRDGRRFLNDLPAPMAARVRAFCDIDPKKVGSCYRCRRLGKEIPIVHFSQAEAPLIICVGTKVFGGAVEANIATLGLTEGVDYFHFN